jgi:hypothetical protein
MARIYRTADGRHVPEGDPDAAFLAYADGDQPPKGVLAEVEGKPAAKRGRKPADKSGPKPDDKSAGTPEEAGGSKGGGVTVTRLRDKGETDA